MKALHLLTLFFLVTSSIYFFGQWWNTTAKKTGLCIFKGPASFGLFSSSDGIPLRDIPVKVWRNSTYTDSIAVIAEGQTDRTGCFTIQEHEGYLDYATYTYNGIKYTDTLIVGAILRDNVP